MWWDGADIDQPTKDMLVQMRSDPVLFAEAVLGVTLRRWQREFLRNVAANPMSAVRSANGVGKTFAIAIAMVWGITLFEDIKIALISTTAGQANRTAWADVQFLFYQLPKWIADHFEVGKTQIYPRSEPWNRAEIVTAAKDAPTTIQGIHCENPWAFVDEASGVEEFIFKMLVGILTDPNPKLVLTGNPNYNSGYFYEAFNRNRAEFVRMKVSRFDIRDDLTKPKEIEAFDRFIQKMRSLYGEESNEYRIRVLGEFPVQDDDTVISRFKINQALKRYHLNTGLSFLPVIWGIDIALYGGDKSALAKRRGPVLLETTQIIPAIDLMGQSYWIADQFNQQPEALKPTEIYIDVTGLGRGVYDRLHELGLPVHPVQAHEAAPTNERFFKLRDELWWRGREWFQGEVWIPSDEELILELSAPRYKYNEQGKFKVESKHQLKTRGFDSPNRADAFLLTMMNNTPGQSWAKGEATRQQKLDIDIGLII